MASDKWDVILVGSGISALVAGTLLAKRGKSVCILEGHSKVGGYLHVFKRFSRRFDTGGHYVGAMGEGQPFHTLLSYLGLRPEEYFTPLDPDGFDVLNFPDFSTSIPVGYAQWESRLCSLFPQEKEGIGRVLKIFQDAVRHFPTYEFATEFDANQTRYFMESPLSNVVENHVSDPKLRAVFYAYCALYGVHPKDIGVGFHSLVIDSLLRGAYGFRQGGDALAKAFVELIEKSGGVVRTRSRVVALENQDRTIQSVRLESGEVLFADWVISSAHPKTTFSLTGTDSLKPVFRSRLAHLQESLPFLGVYARCKPSERINPLKNYYCFSTIDPDVWLEPDAKELSAPLVYLMRPDRTGGVPGEEYGLTFHGPCHQQWFSQWVGTKKGERPAEYGALKNAACAGMIDLAESFFPGLKGEMVGWEGSTNLTNSHYNGTLDGSAYGIYHSISNTGVRALGPQTHFKNLLLTGQSTLFPGLLGASISGLRSAGYLVGMKPVIEDLIRVRGQS